MNNRKTAGRLQLLLTLLVLGFLALWICSLTIRTLMSNVYQYSFGILLLLSLLYFMLAGIYYVEIDLEEDVLNFKFYNAFPFSREFKMYRIPKAAFVKFELSGMLFFRRKMTLFQMTSNQLSKYPPILITAFSSSDLDKLNGFMNGLSHKD